MSALVEASARPAVDLDVATVVSRADVAAGVVELVLGTDTPLPWSAGAHVDLHLGEHVRQYSLCGRPSESTYRVAILKEDGGRGGSVWAHERLHVGDTVAISGPRNHFELAHAPAYVFIAGGIGITPLLPMIAAAETAGADWVLLYGGRTRTSMAYLDELAGYGDKVHVRPQDEHGLLDLAAVLGVPREDTLIYTCGPEPLLAAVEDAAAGWPHGALHLERFAAKVVEHDVDTAFEVVFERSGVTAEVPAGRSVLDVAADHGIFVLKSCSEGVCGTCETLVLDGEPEHRDSVYTEEDHAEGAFAPCVSRCRSARLVLDL